MPSTSNSSNSFVNIESSYFTRTASGSARDVSDSNNFKSVGSSYEWVDPHVLDIPTCLRDSNTLDKFLYKVTFLKLDSPSDALMADICGYTDRVCHRRENAPHDFFFIYNTFFSYLHITLPFDEFTLGVIQILNVVSTQLHPNSWRGSSGIQNYL